MASTSKSYEKARASVEKATGHFADIQTISAKDVLRLEQEGKKVLLVDVRTEDEMKVSMLRGALTRQAPQPSATTCLQTRGCFGLNNRGIVVASVPSQTIPSLPLYPPVLVRTTELATNSRTC
ncbi:unnamed protein product [Ectocarpus sp. CCAP 1310/34]|nr:unnamed protein product [Ectocarpus sp. CCAP 1310/34]